MFPEICWVYVICGICFLHDGRHLRYLLVCIPAVQHTALGWLELMLYLHGLINMFWTDSPPLDLLPMVTSSLGC